MGFLTPPGLHMLGQVVLSHQGNRHMGSYSDVESQIAHPEVGESLSSNGLAHSIENMFVWHFPIRPGLHLL